VGGGGGRGAKSYDGEKAWSYVKHSVLSGESGGIWNPRTYRIFVPSCHLQRSCPIRNIGNSLLYIFNSRNTLGGKPYAF
jgi:hypothetical protein